MIKRIVKMTFQAEKTADFEAIFKNAKPKILNMEGCKHLELWRSTAQPNVFFTYSFWQSEYHLNEYRSSELFCKTWKVTKALFEDKPAAWSVEEIG